mgnify:CR=1 FL=1
MKQILLLLTCIAFLSFTGKPVKDKISVPPTPPIAGVYLYSNNITTGAGNAGEGHPDEVPLAIDSGNATLPVSLGGGGNQAGTPQFGDIFITKAFDITSLRLSSLIAHPVTKTFEIRYYNGVSTTPVYKMVLVNSFVTLAARVKTDCQGSGCIGIKETYSFRFTTIEYHNLMLSPPQILTYNTATNNYTWSNN